MTLLTSPCDGDPDKQLVVLYVVADGQLQVARILILAFLSLSVLTAGAKAWHCLAQNVGPNPPLAMVTTVTTFLSSSFLLLLQGMNLVAFLKSQVALLAGAVGTPVAVVAVPVGTAATGEGVGGGGVSWGKNKAAKTLTSGSFTLGHPDHQKVFSHLLYLRKSLVDPDCQGPPILTSTPALPRSEEEEELKPAAAANFASQVHKPLRKKSKKVQDMGNLLL